MSAGAGASPLGSGSRASAPQARAAAHLRCDVLIVGTGFAGLGLAHTLKQQGIQHVLLVEQAARLGGTWRDNIYPGVACDVPTPLYSYSFALQPLRSARHPEGWSGLYAPQVELQAYLEGCADRFGLREQLRFETTVTRADWDPAEACWHVEALERGRSQRIRARALVSAAGHALRVPVTPSFRGADPAEPQGFQGRQLHTARWDPAVALEGRRVAVVGMGASAAQLIPSIVDRVAGLTVYQRSAPWVLPKLELLADEESRLRRLLALPGGTRAVRWGLYWLMELIAAGHVYDPRLHGLVTEPRARRHLEQQVPDPILRAKLRPAFRLGCKRMVISNDLYPALTRPHVELVTTPIERLCPEGMVTRDGRVRPAEVLIYATGYEAAEAAPPFELRGVGGQRLEEAWHAGPEAYKGTCVAGFPNFFTVVGPNLGQGHTSMVFMMESQYPYIAQAIRRLLAPGGPRSLAVRPEAQARWNDFLQRRLVRTVWNSGGCTSWYLNSAGRNTTAWPGFTFEYWLRMRRFDAACYEAT